MGCGIAQLSAAAGYETILYDLDEKSVSAGYDHIANNLRIATEKGKVSGEAAKNTLERITTTWNFQDLTGDVIIEAIVEKKEVKSELFGGWRRSMMLTLFSVRILLRFQLPLSQRRFSIPKELSACIFSTPLT
jgi:hypothetical protein